MSVLLIKVPFAPQKVGYDAGLYRWPRVKANSSLPCVSNHLLIVEHDVYNPNLLFCQQGKTKM
jgi:hypothetical protein